MNDTPKDQHSSQTTNLRESLRQRLGKSRQALVRGLGSWFQRGNLGDDDFDQLEEILITADIGVLASEKMVAELRHAARAENINDRSKLLSKLREQMVNILRPCEQTIPMTHKPWVLLVVGVNGVGKTTTIAKVAKLLQDQGKSVVLAAADTFRAAAVEQLESWGQRLSLPVVSQQQGADAAAVAHDALMSALARKADILIVDTAGRQHTHDDLMQQLIKIKRVLAKIDDATPHEVMQVLDAGTGQNTLSQLHHFDRAVSVDSLCLTKLDGTAKGGVLLAIAQQFPLPVRYIGVGESFDDLRPFTAGAFVDALLPSDLERATG